MIVHDCSATLKTKVILLICFEKELYKHTCAKQFQVVLFTKIYDDRVYQALQVPHFSNVLFLHKKVQILSIIQDKYTFVLCASTRYLLCFDVNTRYAFEMVKGHAFVHSRSPPRTTATYY